jgi:hypothetical protein
MVNGTIPSDLGQLKLILLFFDDSLDIIIQIFWVVDDEMKGMSKHTQASFYPSELVMIGILFALKGGYIRAFYRWLSRDYADLFPGLPERTRHGRLIDTHQRWCDCMLAAHSFFTVIDSYPIELLFPVRQRRSPQQVGKKSKDKGRWSVGIKLCWLFNVQEKVVAWDWDTISVADQQFHPVNEKVNEQSIILADYGFRSVDGVPDNCKLCAKGTWDERMCVETALSIVTVICGLKRIHHRLSADIQARLASMSAVFNVLLMLFHRLRSDADPFQMGIAEFSA